MIFFVSDTHFNHDNVIKYSHRPFANATEMNEHMIRVWNGRVAANDTVYHLGDVIFPAKNEHHISSDELMSRLNGIKHLIVGNHDREKYKDKEALLIKDHWGWESVDNYAEIKFGKSRFVVCHYPFETWRNAHRGWYHLHGHSHGNLKRVIAHRLDVGVDCMPDYAPISAEELVVIFKAQTGYVAADHHGD